MAFTIPTFNLMCNIHSGDVWPPPPTRVVSPCNLAMGTRRIQQFSNEADTPLTVAGSIPLLLLPALTDVRDQSQGLVSDFVECPAASGRWYQVTCVDDSGKGFPNEFRIATMCKIFLGALGPGTFPGLLWPTPMP